MANASWEEATRCPKCGQPGSDIDQRPGTGRSTVHVILCLNERCKWWNTSWLVQVKADGTIPVRKQGPAEYPTLTNFQTAMARRVLEDLEFEQTGKEPRT